MGQILHESARTTEAVRRAISDSQSSMKNADHAMTAFYGAMNLCMKTPSSAPSRPHRTPALAQFRRAMPDAAPDLPRDFMALSGRPLRSLTAKEALAGREGILFNVWPHMHESDNRSAGLAAPEYRASFPLAPHFFSDRVAHVQETHTP